MKARTLAFLTILLCICTVSFSCTEQGKTATVEKKVTVDWSNPDTIDLGMEGLGDHLEINLGEYRRIANEAYSGGDFEKAAKYYLALSRFGVGDSNALYNLACCFGLLGKAEPAAYYLGKAVNAGFTDYRHIQEDRDFAKVRESVAFKKKLSDIVSVLERIEKTKPVVTQIEGKSFINCHVVFPANFDAEKEYPLVVGLHGFGANPVNFAHLWDRVEHKDFIYVVPQAPYPIFSSGREGYSWLCTNTQDAAIWKRSSDNSIEYILSTVTEFKDKYNVSGTYLIGFSQGARMALATGISSPGLFSGVVAFGGFLDTDSMYGSSLAGINKLRIFLAHGTEDTVVDIKNSQAVLDFLSKKSCPIVLEKFKGGHAVPVDVLKKAETWMFK